jgi:hypothetical protein
MLKLKSVHPPETLVFFYQTTRHHIPRNGILQSHCLENLKSHCIHLYCIPNLILFIAPALNVMRWKDIMGTRVNSWDFRSFRRNMKIAVFWDIILCNLMDHYLLFRVMCCFHLQGTVEGNRFRWDTVSDIRRERSSCLTNSVGVHLLISC